MELEQSQIEHMYKHMSKPKQNMKKIKRTQDIQRTIIQQQQQQE
jgi:hypothetical protein